MRGAVHVVVCSACSNHVKVGKAGVNVMVLLKIMIGACRRVCVWIHELEQWGNRRCNNKGGGQAGQWPVDTAVEYVTCIS